MRRTQKVAHARLPGALIGFLVLRFEAQTHLKAFEASVFLKFAMGVLRNGKSMAARQHLKTLIVFDSYRLWDDRLSVQLLITDHKLTGQVA
jgi:hypothetical protein